MVENPLSLKYGFYNKSLQKDDFLQNPYFNKLFILNFQFKSTPKENIRKSGKMAFPFNFNPHSDKTKLKYDCVIRNAGKTLCKLKKFLNPFCFVCKVQTF